MANYSCKKFSPTT